MGGWGGGTGGGGQREVRPSTRTWLTQPCTLFSLVCSSAGRGAILVAKNSSCL